jgi:hypothetical protein
VVNLLSLLLPLAVLLEKQICSQIFKLLKKMALMGLSGARFEDDLRKIPEIKHLGTLSH